MIITKEKEHGQLPTYCMQTIINRSTGEFTQQILCVYQRQLWQLGTGQADCRIQSAPHTIIKIHTCQEHHPLFKMIVNVAIHSINNFILRSLYDIHSSINSIIVILCSTFMYYVVFATKTLHLRFNHCYKNKEHAVASYSEMT